MNVNELIFRIKEVALSQQTVNSVYDGDVYANWNSAEAKYSSVNIGIQEISNQDNFTTYSVILYYGDRLLQDKKNTNSIYTDGTNTLQSIINILNTIDMIDIAEPVTYKPFEQQFMDYLAGVYCQIQITTDSMIGDCSLDNFEYIDEKDKLIEELIEKINQYKIEDERLSVLLQSILHRLTGEGEEEQLAILLQEILFKICGETIEIEKLKACNGNTDKLAELLRSILYRIDGEIVN